MFGNELPPIRVPAAPLCCMFGNELIHLWCMFHMAQPLGFMFTLSKELTSPYEAGPRCNGATSSHWAYETEEGTP